MSKLIEFCPNCSTLLLITKLDNKPVYKCRTCPYHIPLSPFIHTIYFNKPIAENIVLNENRLDQLAKTEKTCEKCNYHTAAFIEMQTRSADEPMTIFYNCVKCKYTWKE